MHPLESVCEFKYGRSLPKESRNGGEISVYGSNGVIGHHTQPFTQGPTIIIGRKGSTGAIQFSATSCCPIDTTYYIDRTCTNADLRWLFYTLHSLQLDRLGKHVAIPGLSRSDAYLKKVPLPPLDEQKLIAAVLDKADNLRRLRQKSLNLTEKLIQSAFLDMFGNPVNNPGKWPVRRLGEFGIVQTGNTPPRRDPDNYASEGTEWIKTNNIPEDGLIVEPALEKLSEKGYQIARVAPADSILVTCIAGSDKSIGRAALTDRKVAFNQQINAITPHKDTSPIFLYYMLKVSRRHIQNAAGVGMKKMINKSTFENIIFIDPPYETLQLEFEKKANVILKHAQNLSIQSPIIDDLFSSLQQRAFRGDLDLTLIKLETGEKQIVEQENPAIVESRKYNKPGHFISPPEIEKEMKSLEEQLDFGRSDSIPWSENYFKYRILGQILTSPFSFNEIWEAVENDFEEPHYEKVKDTVLIYIKSGVLKQQFDKKRKEIVLSPS